jgi:DNA primase
VEQVRLIKRFTTNVTLIYDADAAGIKASLRGIELLLQDGMDIKVLLLPPGEDPDSFAQSHSSAEVNDYIKANETDFITFMARILLKDVDNDPTGRANVITQIVKTIALIPNEITRSVYVQECSNILFISEDVLRREVGRYFNEYALKSREDRLREASLTTDHRKADEDSVPSAGRGDTDEPESEGPKANPISSHAAFLRKYEMNLLRLVARYGNLTLADSVDENDNVVAVSVLEYIESDLQQDGIALSNPDLAHFLSVAHRASRESWEESYRHEMERLQAERSRKFAAGIEEIRAKATDVGSITAMERALNETIDAEYSIGLEDFCADYLSRILCSSPDDAVRNLATELVVERYTLSKVHTKYAHVETEREQLVELVPRAIHELKDAILNTRVIDARGRLKQACESNDYASTLDAMREIKDLETLRSSLAKLIGDRVIAPRK